MQGGGRCLCRKRDARGIAACGCAAPRLYWASCANSPSRP